MDRFSWQNLAFALLLSSQAHASCMTSVGFKSEGSSTWRTTPNGFDDAPNWERLPLDIPSDISASMRATGKQSTGRALHFITNADVVRVCWTMAPGTEADLNWSANGRSGIDVYYRRQDGIWRWLLVGEPKDPTVNVVEIPFGATGPRELLVYLPSARRISEVRVEVPDVYTVEKGRPPSEKPLVAYGSSIEQGAGTSRPGIIYVAQLGRALNRDAINLGFGGAGSTITGMAQLLARIDASIFLLDPFPNMNPSMITEQLFGFVDFLASARPDADIFILQDRLNQSSEPHAQAGVRLAENLEAMTPIIKRLRMAHPRVHFIPSADFLGSDREATVDGSHPSDLGHMRMKDAILSAIQATGAK